MNKIRYGIIGLGNQGSYYTNGIFGAGKVENAIITALCDNNPSKINAMKSKLINSDITYFEDYKKMLDSGLCDAVIVAVPHYQHPEMVIECLKRDINVICEKPAGVYADQVKEMIREAPASKALFGMMFNQRTNCIYRKMREIIAKGGIGELQRVTWIITSWFRSQHYYNTGSWRATWEGEGGGVLINQCPHQLDLVQWVVGEMPEYVTSFCSYGKWHDIEVEDDVTAFFEYKNGATGTFITNTGEAPGTNRFEVAGSGGKLVVENDKLTYYKNSQDSLECLKNTDQSFPKIAVEKISVETDGENPQHVGIIQNFTDALLGKKELFVRGEEGVNSVELMNAIELSSWLGNVKVKVPVDGDLYFAKLQEQIKKSEYRKKVCEDKISDTNDSFKV